jgi:coenzyme F420-reducing hydrogenase delta subunit
LKQFGLNSERLELAWVSAGEAQNFADTVNNFIERVIKLGPSPYRKARQSVAAAGDSREVVDV